MTTKDQEYQNNLTDLSDFLSQHVNDLTARLEALEGKQAPVESEPDKNTYQLANDSTLAVFLASESEPVVDKSWPQVGDKYWVADLHATFTKCIWDNDSLDKALAARGLIFRTKEEAEKADQLRLAMHELKVMSEKEWTGSSQSPERFIIQYYAVYDTVQHEWYAYKTHNLIVPGVVCFPTNKSAVAAYKAVDAKYEGILR